MVKDAFMTVLKLTLTKKRKNRFSNGRKIVVQFGLNNSFAIF